MDPGEFQKQSDLAAMMEVMHYFLVKEEEAHPGKLDICRRFKKSYMLI